MSPESEGASGGETSTQEKPCCPYLRGEGYTALPTSEGEKAGPIAARGVAGATATDIGEAKATETTEGKATKTTEGEATETAESEATETTTKATEEKASGTSQGKATAATEAETTETSKSEETEILVEAGGTGGLTPAGSWSTTPGSTSASPSSEELPCEHGGLATGIGSYARRSAAATTLSTEPGPSTSQPAEEVPYKLVYEPPVLHHEYIEVELTSFRVEI
ncbi:hypothetical protein FOZ63_029912 [Perkinsus olseni]|uniref:Uncharacterized protein n=1 Tax=Perkinsus olseni TaxID=32597 RepID=A0A7J6U674_PEROL|nr:hypothetical protein FOZ63_029912 [Perkinsus olseni]